MISVTLRIVLVHFLFTFDVFGWFSCAKMGSILISLFNGHLKFILTFSALLRWKKQQSVMQYIHYAELCWIDGNYTLKKIAFVFVLMIVLFLKSRLVELLQKSLYQSYLVERIRTANWWSHVLIAIYDYLVHTKVVICIHLQMYCWYPSHVVKSRRLCLGRFSLFFEVE